MILFRFGLRTRGVLALAGALFGGAIVAWPLVSFWVGAGIEEDLRMRARLVASVLEGSSAVHLAVLLDDADQAQAELDRLLSIDPDVTYVAVVEPSGTAVAWTSSDPKVREALMRPEKRQHFLAGHRANVPWSDQGWVRETVPIELHFAQPEGDEEPESPRVSPPAADVRPSSQAPKKLLNVLIGLDPKPQRDRFRELSAITIGLAGALVLLLSWFFLHRLFSRIEALRRQTEKLAEGDLTVRPRDTARDELGGLSTALGLIAHNWSSTISEVRAASIKLNSVSDEVQAASEKIAADTAVQGASMDKTSAAFEAMDRSSHSVDTEIGQATRSAQAGNVRLREISEALETGSEMVQRLMSAVDKTQRHLKNSVKSLSEVDHAVDRMISAAVQTASATAEISANINSVEGNAGYAQRMSSSAAERARQGAQSVGQMVSSVGQIRSFAQESIESVRVLSQRVSSIETILEVISDIANKTKLLSLNASIIAAQAGEHGVGFLVVADEIKALAAKTAGSTDEISNLIHEVLDESQKALKFVDRGVATVDQAVARSQEADDVLKELVEASSQVGSMVRSVAAATAEQSRGSAQVAEAMEEVKGVASDLREIVTAQVRESQELDVAVAEMRSVMSRSRKTMEVQASQAREAVEAVDAIFEKVERISKMNGEQTTQRSEVSQAFSDLAELSENSRAVVHQLYDSVGEAAHQAQALTQGVKRFRI